VLEDLPAEMLEGMKIHFVRTAEQALEIALGKFEKKPVRPVSGGEQLPVIGPVSPVH
jgi:hypothetical protein